VDPPEFEVVDELVEEEDEVEVEEVTSIFHSSANSYPGGGTIAVGGGEGWLEFGWVHRDDGVLLLLPPLVSTPLPSPGEEADHVPSSDE